MSKEDYIFIEIGVRQHIHDRYSAIKAGLAFTGAAKINPKAHLAFMIGGYDEDKRELWEVPEVMQYVRWFANASGLDDWRDERILRLHQDSIGLLVLSNSFVDDKHPFKVEHQ
jgi:hypothetical protein